MVGVLRLFPLVLRLKQIHIKFVLEIDAMHLKRGGCGIGACIVHRGKILTWHEHVLECETLSLWIGQISCCNRQTDTRTADRLYVFSHVFCNNNNNAF